MPRFARMLADGMIARGHSATIWAPQSRFSSLASSGAARKWLGYIDQYILFPGEVRSRVNDCPSDTLFVFTDQALGPWVPLVAHRPHVIHCHDFLAQRSALGEIPENTTGWTGRQYQDFIYRGYSRGKHFISVSQKTSEDLHRFLPAAPACSKVVYNGLNQPFAPQNTTEARRKLSSRMGLDLAAGYLLHVGGNNFYKNRTGVIELYNAWRSTGGNSLPLLLIGDAPNQSLLNTHAQSSFKADIHFQTGIEDEFVQVAYAGASVFLFPSLAEGFGWPIAEAMASGCPVITTNESPMTEVAGDAGILIPRRPINEAGAAEWAAEGAHTISKIIGLTPHERLTLVEAGLKNAKRFDAGLALNQIETIYQTIFSTQKNS